MGFRHWAYRPKLAWKRRTCPARSRLCKTLHASLLRVLPGPQAEILTALLEAHSEALAKDRMANRIGVSRTSGGYFNSQGRLRTLGAIDYPSPGKARTSSILFEKAGTYYDDFRDLEEAAT